MTDDFAEELAKYPLPAFLEGRCTPSVFYKWMNCKADTLFRRDKKRGMPYAKTASKSIYKAKIYAAVVASGNLDPFTGDSLAWELIGSWDDTKASSDEYKRKYALLPTIDHADVDVLEFEICSWLVNECKCDLTPEEFRTLCLKVVDWAGSFTRKSVANEPLKQHPIKYPLPAFLDGRCTPPQFYKWLTCKGMTMLRRDKKRGMPYAKNATISTYKAEIYNAVIKSGDCDPFTGDLLAWEQIGTWDTSETHDAHYKEQFALMPTVDHVNPEAFDFEICSWLVNDSKSYLTPDEFRALCRKVVDREGKNLRHRPRGGQLQLARANKSVNVLCEAHCSCAP